VSDVLTKGNSPVTQLENFIITALKLSKLSLISEDKHSKEAVSFLNASTGIHIEP
jgi:hypothetical protein